MKLEQFTEDEVCRSAIDNTVCKMFCIEPGVPTYTFDREKILRQFEGPRASVSLYPMGDEAEKVLDCLFSESGYEVTKCKLVAEDMSSPLDGSVGYLLVKKPKV